jgi:hypothetical protein
MHARFFHKIPLKQAKRSLGEFPISNPGFFDCLKGHDVIAGRVSDHHPVIHNGVLFWNIMMQGRARGAKGGFNNGFGMIETEKQYMKRLHKVAHVIAEIIYNNPDIETIGLCEGPIEISHVNVLYKTLKQYEWMERFFGDNLIHKPDLASHPHWGLLMLNGGDGTVSKISLDLIIQPSIFSKLANRIQLWKLTKEGEEKYYVLAHFPFGGDEYVTEKENLSRLGLEYNVLINRILDHYAEKNLTFCADFNFNPSLLKKWQDRYLDQITENNSILLTSKEKEVKSEVKAVTVDGILLSIQEKQKYHTLRYKPNLIDKLMSEYTLFKTHIKNLYYNAADLANERLQQKHDKRYGLITI